MRLGKLCTRALPPPDAQHRTAQDTKHHFSPRRGAQETPPAQRERLVYCICPPQHRAKGETGSSPFGRHTERDSHSSCNRCSDDPHPLSLPSGGRCAVEALHDVARGDDGILGFWRLRSEGRTGRAAGSLPREGCGWRSLCDASALQGDTGS